MAHLRHIILENAHNFRDLGGYPMADGRHTKWGVLYRSDALSSLNEKEWTFLEEVLGIRLIIDLRSKKEQQNAPISPTNKIRSLCFSLMKDLDELTDETGEESSETSASEKILKSMKLDYTETLFGNLECAVEILQTIFTALSTEEAVVFLCSAGKDRTGIIAALLLYLCNVPREDIIADYMVSSTYNANGINRDMSSLPKELLDLIPDDISLEECFASDPKTMIPLLDAFEQKDIRRCLDTHGFTYEKQEKLVSLIAEA